MTVIPAINAKTLEEAKASFQKIKGFAEWIHIDIVDGVFASPKTWGSPEELEELGVGTAKVEVHLMVKNPELVISSWLETGVHRIIVHVESMQDSEVITDACREEGIEVFLAANPKTPVEELIAEARNFSGFQILTVPPGKAGQTFDMQCTEKIRALRAKMPRATIEVDGGMNAETGALVKEAGANIIISASYILNAANPEAAYRSLL